MAEGPAALRTRRRSLDSYPSLDLGSTVVYALACFVAVVLLGATPLTRVFVLPLLFFVPGYGIVAGLYPASGATEAGIDGVERAALSFGVSFALLPLVGIALAGSSGGLTAIPLVATLGAIAIGGAGIGAVRRSRTPADERFRLSIGDSVRQFANAVGDSPLHVSALYLLLSLAVLLAVGMLGGVLFFPDSGESYSGLAVLTEDENGSYVAGEYPDDLGAGESSSLVATVSNNEGQQTNYTLVVQVQRVEYSDSAVQVLDRRTVTERRRSVDAGETWNASHSVTLEQSDEQRRLVYLLYRGDAPADPRVDSAYRHAYVHVDGSA